MVPGRVFPQEFVDELYHQETRNHGLSAGEDPVILVCLVWAQSQRVTDRRTDGRTDERIDDC